MIYVEKQWIWEYNQITRNLEGEKPIDATELNELGEGAWEMLGVAHVHQHKERKRGFTGMIVVFKPKHERIPMATITQVAENIQKVFGEGVANVVG